MKAKKEEEEQEAGPSLKNLQEAHRRLNEEYKTLFPDSFWELVTAFQHLQSQEWTKPSQREEHDDIRLPKKLQHKMRDHLKKLLQDLELDEWADLDRFLVEDLPLKEWISNVLEWVEKDQHRLEPLYEWNKCGLALQDAWLLPKLNEKGIPLSLPFWHWFGFVPYLPYDKFLLFGETSEAGEQLFSKLVLSMPEKVDRAVHFLRGALSYMAHMNVDMDMDMDMESNKKENKKESEEWNKFYSQFRLYQEEDTLLLKTKGFGDRKDVLMSFIRLDLKPSEIQEIKEAIVKSGAPGGSVSSVGSLVPEGGIISAESQSPPAEIKIKESSPTAKKRGLTTRLQIDPLPATVRDALMSPPEDRQVFMSSKFGRESQSIYYDYLWRNFSFNPNSKCDILGETCGFVVNLGSLVTNIVQYFQKEER